MACYLRGVTCRACFSSFILRKSNSKQICCMSNILLSKEGVEEEDGIILSMIQTVCTQIL